MEQQLGDALDLADILIEISFQLALMLCDDCLSGAPLVEFLLVRFMAICVSDATIARFH